MKLQMYAVYDSKVEMYMEPFFAQTNGAALRMFADAANSEGHQFNRHAADYTLFNVGAFDQDAGMLEPSAPVTLGNALEYREDRS